MNATNILNGKRILIVDDEPDVLESLSELLDMCRIDTASDFESAEKLLNREKFDVAVLDIMGVQGYDLLEIANKNGIPAIMFTAHALSPDNFVKSIKGGAKAYIPKDKMPEIATFVADLLTAHENNVKYRGWYGKLKKFFDNQFGPDWMEKYKEFKKQYGEYFTDE
ncbi:MAG: response regulator [Desulfobacterales bacterium]|nr:response regulator [Desulfobacterales bacterium]